MQRALAERTSSRRSSARATVIGLPERFASTVAPASAASALGGTGTHMSSQISTCSAKPGHVGGAEDQVGAERHLGAGRRVIVAPAPVVAGREPAPLVELAVGRQVGLRRHAEDPAAVDDDRAVEDPGAVHQRRADHDHRAAGRSLAATISATASCTPSSRVSCRNRSSIDVAAQAQLGEDRDRDAVVVAGPRPARARSRRWRAGSAIATGTVQAATRANPWAYAE